MNISSIWSRKAPLKTALVSLEDSMEDALKEELLSPEPEIETESFGAGELLVIEDEGVVADVDEADDADLPAVREEPQEDRITPHSRRRLMDHSAFEDSQARISEEVGRISDALAAIVAAAHVTRDYAADSLADIHRANDLETGNIA